MPEQTYLSVAEAARQLGLSKERVLQFIRAGDLPAEQLGTGKNAPYMINPEELRRFQDARNTKGDQP